MQNMADRRINIVLLVIFRFCSFSVAQELSNPLDIGGVYTCVVPNSTVCNISYPVPESISFLSEIKDAFIAGKIGQITETESKECRDGLTQILCSEEYPHCNENKSIVTVPIPTNCPNILNSCKSDFSSQYCDFTLSNNTSLGNCRSIQSHMSELTNYAFAECDQLGSKWLSNYVTEWMFHYLKRIDLKVRNVLQSTLTNLNEECKLQYRMFMCSEIGRCWHQGERLELTVNKTDCLNLRNRW